MNFSHLLYLTDPAEFLAAVGTELNAHPHWLPTQKACDRGWPRDVVVDRITDLKIHEASIEATVHVSFTEWFATGCSDTASLTPRGMECWVGIDRRTGEERIGVSEPEKGEEF